MQPRSGAQLPVQAGRAGAGYREECERGHVEQGQLSVVLDRYEAVARMSHEIGYEHLERKERGDRSGPKPRDHEQATEEFHHAGQAHESEQGLHLIAAKHAEKFLGAVLHEQQADEHASDRMGSAANRRGMEEVEHRFEELVKRYRTYY